MIRSFPHISTVVLSSAFLFAGNPSAGRGVHPQEPAAPATGQTPTSAQAPAAAQTPAGPPAPAVNNPVKSTPESQAKARKTYGYDCAMCHAANGDGKTDLAKDMQLSLTDLGDPKSLDGKTDGDLFQAIRNGKGKMPGEDASRAKDNDIWSLVTYVRAMARKSAPPAAPAH